MGGKSGGDGGAAEQARIKAEQDSAINKLNTLFGVADPASMVDKSKFTTFSPATYQHNIDTGQESHGRNGGSDLAFTSRHGSRGMAGDNPLGDFRQNPQNQQFDQAGYDAALAETSQENALTKSMREGYYSNAGQDVFNFKKTDLDRNKAKADRELKFQLARTGQLGGSLQIDQNNEVADNYNRGLLDIGNLKQSTINNARANDETSRIDLVGRIRAGMNQADALNAASSQQQSNLNQARDTALGQTITDYFSGMKYLQGKNQYAQDYTNTMAKFGAGQPKAFNGITGAT